MLNRFVRERIVIGDYGSDDDKHIVLCGDERYIKFCGITLTTIVLSNMGDCFTFHIFCDDINEIDFIKLKNTSSKFRINIIVYKLNINLITTLGRSLNTDMNSISVATFFRLISFEVLNEYASKALYLDSDMMVIGEIGCLWNFDMGDSYAIVVDYPTNEEHKRRVGVERYFNAGMVFCNIQKWNQDGLTDYCLDYIYKEKPEWMDQDALNRAFKDNCIYLDKKWNFLADLETVIDYEKKPSKSNFLVGRNDLLIIHFVGRNKPWCHWVQCIPIVKRYMNLVEKSFWYDLKVQQVEDINDYKYRYKHTRMELVMAWKENEYYDCVYYACKYISNKIKYYINKL